MGDLEEKHTEIVSNLTEQSVMMIEKNRIVINNLLDRVRIPSMLDEQQMILHT